MNPDKSSMQKIRVLFEKAIAIPRSERPAFLETAAVDATTRQVLDRMIQKHEDSLTLLSERDRIAMRKVLLDSMDEDWTGKRLGAYQIVKKIDQGGMGSIYLADRADAEFDKRVAVKFIKGDRLGEQALERFRRERQILAKLQHPYIARLLDGGTAPGGSLYLVMDHIQGEAITIFCDRKRLPVRERVRLVRELCSAVQYAHQNLVVHRDIKPGNVLVNERLEPILLDFGIAKILGNASPEREHELAPTLILSPSYASPEQIFAKPVTTASDIYSLGVLLYELCCGKRPYEAGGRDLEGYRQIIRQTSPPAPSHWFAKVPLPGNQDRDAAKIAANRAISVKGLNRLLRGDLDQIIGKALQKEPQNRYATVQQFAEDLERYSAGQVVTANRGNWLFRFGKFARRNRLTVTALALLFLLSAGFLVHTQIQNARIVHERDRVQNAFDMLRGFFRIVDPEEVQGEALTALEFLEISGHRMSTEFTESPDLAADMYVAIGEIYLNLGFLHLAEPLVAKALALRKDLFGEKDIRTAECFQLLGLLRYYQGAYEQAEKAILSALAVRRENSEQFPNSESSLLLGRTYRAMGRRKDALPFFEEAVKILQVEPKANQKALANARMEMGYTLLLMREFERAEPLLLEALHIMESQYSGARPLTARILRELANLHLRKRQPLQARPFLEKSLAMNRRLYGQEHKTIAINLHDLGRLQARLGHVEEAEDLYLESLEIKRRVLGPWHSGLAGTLLNLAKLQQKRGALEQSEELFQKARAIHLHSMGENINLAFQYWAFGSLLIDLGRFHEAEQELCRAVDLFQRYSSKPDQRVAQTKTELARCLAAMGRTREARALAEAALPLLPSNSDEASLARKIREGVSEN